jgi:hypothetical protein
MRRVALTVAIAALLLAGCSSNSSPPETSSPAPSPAEHGSLAECLQANGVSDSGGAPAVLGPPPGVDQGTWDEAMKACSTFAPGPAPGPAGP